MSDLTLKGNLKLMGNLKLNPNGGKVLVGSLEALIETIPPGEPHHGMAPPVILPPPPAAPVDAGPKVWVINSFNKTVIAGPKSRPLVTQGMAMQGNIPTWPGMVLPSQNNQTVMANMIPINVVNDQAIIFPSGGTATFTASGQ